MERTFKTVYKDLMEVYLQEVKELSEKNTQWKERFSEMRQQKLRAREEYTALRKENCQLRTELTNLKESLQDKTAYGYGNQPCRVCESLQKALDKLHDSYKETLQEKDNLLRMLDAKLSEYSLGESYLAKIRQSFNTPNKSLLNSSDGNLNRHVSSDKKQSPDSTIITPRRPVTRSDTQENGEDCNKSTKLSLPKGKQKRHKYSENTPPKAKRQRTSENSVKSGDGVKTKNKTKTTLTPQVLVPETCDFLSQSDSVIANESNSSQIHNAMRKDPSLPEINSNGNNNNNARNAKSKRGVNKPLIYTSEVKVVPETVQVDMFEGDTSSEEEEESDSDDSSQQTIKKAGLTQSVHSVLCSPPSSEDEDDILSDMTKAVNHRTMALSGQSNYAEKEAELNDRENRSRNNNYQREDNDRTLQESMNETHKDENICKKRTLNVKPFNKSHNMRVKSQERPKDSISNLPGSLTSDPETHGVKVSGKISQHSGPMSPVYNIKTSVRPNIGRSPGLFDGDFGGQEDPESPLLLRTTGSQLEKSNSSKCPKSPCAVIDLDSDIESPVLTKLSSKICHREKSLSSTEASSEGKTMSRTSQSSGKTVTSKSPKKKSLKLTKPSVVMDTNESNMSRSLRQTTLSQVFNNSPNKDDRPVRKRDKEEEDIRKAIQLSLKDVSSRLDFDETVKENTPPFKKPSFPAVKAHRANSSPHKSRDKKLNSSLHSVKGQRSPKNDKFQDNTRRSLRGKGVNRQSHGADSSKMEADSLLDETLPPVMADKHLDVNGSLDPALQLSQLCQDSENTHYSEIVQSYQKNKKSERGTAKETDNIDKEEEDMNDITVLDDNAHWDRKPLMSSTCVDDVDSQTIPSSSTSVKFGSRTRRKRISLPACEVNSIAETQQDGLDDEDPMVDIDDRNPMDMDDSFDRVKKKEDSFAYVDVVRKQNERRKLNAFDCKECYEYYKEVDLPEEEKRKRMQECSRHRARYVPPQTPEHFWSIGFPDTQECEERGYINKEEDVPEQRPTFRRRRKLNKIFKSRHEEEGADD